MFRINFLLIILLGFMVSCSKLSTNTSLKLPKVNNQIYHTANSTQMQLSSTKQGQINESEQTNKENSDIQPLEKEVVISPQEIEKLAKNHKNELPAIPALSEKGSQKTKLFHFKLPLKNTKYTKQYFDYYANINRKTFQKWLKRAKPYIPYIQKVFREYHIPDDLIFLPFSESGFNPIAYSRAGAAGIWQFMPTTARKYGLTVNWWIDERLDPYRSTIAAAKYLTDLYDMFGDWYLVLAAYNAGEAKIQKALKQSKKNDFFHIARPRYLHRETRMYVPKFMAILKIIRNLEELGFESIKVDKSLILERIFVKEGTDLYKFSNMLGLKWKEFKKLNPHFRRYVTPPDVMSQVYVPHNLVSKAKKLIMSKKIQPYGGLFRYKIRYGDSWWRLSRKFGVPISILKKINRTHLNLLRPGRSILIPKSPKTIFLARKISKQKVLLSKKRRNRRGNYVVKKGDSLWSISKKFNIPLSTLIVANNLHKNSILRPGMRLYIPVSDSKSLTAAKKALKQILYRVKKGDNLWNIARKFGVSTNQLLTWNNLKKDATIYPGDELKILIDVVEN